MIGKLRGIIDSINTDAASPYAIIDVNGVGYVVFISAKTASFLKQLPQEQQVSLTIETIVREDAIELYGFSSVPEKTWFLELMKVQGIGAKVAQKILGFFSLEDLAKALAAGDDRAFSKVSGIGPKLASRITTELKESPKKLGIDVGSDVTKLSSTKNFTSNAITEDALSALENLGYRKHDCLKVIGFLIEKTPEITLENLITSALRELSKNKF
jgi:Holliday junction DNA helicase RuvA